MLLGDGSHGRSVSCELAVSGSERAVLLAQWLDELVYRAETEGLVPDDVQRISLGERSLMRSYAVITAHRVTSPGRRPTIGWRSGRPVVASARWWCSMSDPPLAVA